MAAELTDEQLEQFEATLASTVEFFAALRSATGPTEPGDRVMAATVRPRRRLVLFLAIGFGVLAALVGVGLYGLVLAPTPSTPTTAVDPTAPAAPAVDPEPSASSADASPIRSTSDAESFARDAAYALINWDAATDFDPADYAQVIVDAGDPSGAETAGLASDVRTYLPTADAWLTLRTYGTRQWLTIDEAFVPASWSDAIDQADTWAIAPRNHRLHDHGNTPSRWHRGDPGSGDVSTDRVHTLHRVRAEFRRVPSAPSL